MQPFYYSVFKIAFPISVLNALARLVFFPGQAPVLAFIVSFMPLLTMLLGVFLAKTFIQKWNTNVKLISSSKVTICLTALGVAVRAGIMPFVDYAQYHFLFPLFFGRNFSESFILALMPGIIAYNFLVPLYGVSIGYLIARSVNKSLKLGNIQ